MLSPTNENSDIHQVYSIYLHSFPFPFYSLSAYDNTHFFTKGPDLTYFITFSAIKNQTEQLDAFTCKL